MDRVGPLSASWTVDFLPTGCWALQRVQRSSGSLPGRCACRVLGSVGAPACSEDELGWLLDDVSFDFDFDSPLLASKIFRSMPLSMVIEGICWIFSRSS